MTRRRVVLRGRVQGVGFRYTVLLWAQRRPVAGTVRNLQSDAVEINVEGEPKDLDGFVADVLANAPPGARVDEILTDEMAPSGARGFKVAPSR